MEFLVMASRTTFRPTLSSFNNAPQPYVVTVERGKNGVYCKNRDLGCSRTFALPPEAAISNWFREHGLTVRTIAQD